MTDAVTARCMQCREQEERLEERKPDLEDDTEEPGQEDVARNQPGQLPPVLLTVTEPHGGGPVACLTGGRVACGGRGGWPEAQADSCGGSPGLRPPLTQPPHTTNTHNQLGIFSCGL